MKKTLEMLLVSMLICRIIFWTCFMASLAAVIFFSDFKGGWIVFLIALIMSIVDDAISAAATKLEYEIEEMQEQKEGKGNG